MNVPQIIEFEIGRYIEEIVMVGNYLLADVEYLIIILRQSRFSIQNQMNLQMSQIYLVRKIKHSTLHICTSMYMKMSIILVSYTSNVGLDFVSSLFRVHLTSMLC